jgi:tRNA (cmo5U34)-methyltransferase
MDTVRPFTDRAAIASYAEDAPRKVPGYADLHRMAMILLTEHAAPAANILVYGAGGGLELKAFAEAQAGWRFTGIDPSAEMLDLARSILEPELDRIVLRQGYIEDAPAGPFDGAACLLTLHFLEPGERLNVLRAIRGRLRPGARLVVAHHSYPTDNNARSWLACSIAFSDRQAHDPVRARASAEMMRFRLPILSPEEDEALLHDAGYSDVALFYTAFSFRGWVAIA